MKGKTSKAHIKAQVKYSRKTYKRIEVKLRKDSDKDMIYHLSKHEPVSVYIKELIRKDMGE